MSKSNLYEGNDSKIRRRPHFDDESQFEVEDYSRGKEKDKQKPKRGKKRYPDDYEGGF